MNSEEHFIDDSHFIVIHRVSRAGKPALLIYQSPACFTDPLTIIDGICCSGGRVDAALQCGQAQLSGDGRA